MVKCLKFVLNPLAMPLNTLNTNIHRPMSLFFLPKEAKTRRSQQDHQQFQTTDDGGSEIRLPRTLRTTIAIAVPIVFAMAMMVWKISSIMMHMMQATKKTAMTAVPDKTKTITAPAMTAKTGMKIILTMMAMTVTTNRMPKFHGRSPFSPVLPRILSMHRTILPRNLWIQSSSSSSLDDHSFMGLLDSRLISPLASLMASPLASLMVCTWC